MVELQEIQASLNSNPSLADDTKQNILELVTIFHNTYPNVNLSNLKERLKTLDIKRGSRFVIKAASTYDPIENVILLDANKLSNQMDGKHILMRELLHVITAKDNYTGFNQGNAYEALNLGYTEILANFLVGNEAECEYEDEIIATNMLAGVIGDDTLFNAYFNNDASLLMSQVG